MNTAVKDDSCIQEDLPAYRLCAACEQKVFGIAQPFLVTEDGRLFFCSEIHMAQYNEGLSVSKSIFLSG